jgi:hypothetical protein
MIREAVETLGPPGILPSQEVVITIYGPEPIHEAQAIVDALTKILNPEIKTILNPEVQELREAVYPFTFRSHRACCAVNSLHHGSHVHAIDRGAHRARIAC